MQLEVTHFTDPACPFAFSAEPTPLATAEAAVVAQLDQIKARSALSCVARPLAGGADLYWTLRGDVT